MAPELGVMEVALPREVAVQVCQAYASALLFSTVKHTGTAGTVTASKFCEYGTFNAPHKVVNETELEFKL